MTTAADSQPSRSGARERILATAHDLFYRHGVRATGIDRVIAESGVAKQTFYRHFPSKNDLVRAFLERRHAFWMAWFRAALQRHGGDVKALPAALAEWFDDAAYRGCAFINTVGELADELPEVVEITRRHKADMTAAIAELLPPSPASSPASSPGPAPLRAETALALAVAVDGAIIRAQYDLTPRQALAALNEIVGALTGGGG